MDYPGTNLYVGVAANAPPDMIRGMLDSPVIYIDLETTGLSPYRDRTALMQLHERQGNNTLLIQAGFTEDWLVELFRRKDATFVGHNVAMFDQQFLAGIYGVGIFDLRWYDSLIAESLISTSGRRDVSVSLRASVRRRVGLDLDKSVEHGHWDAVNLSPEQVRYAVQDVLALVDLHDAQVAKAAEQGAGRALALEMEVAPVLGRMSWNGLPLPHENFMLYVNQQAAMADTAEALLFQSLGKLNFNSPKQVINALNRAGIPLQSTNNAILMDYLAVAPPGPKYDIIKALVDYRAPKKRTSMYSQEWYADFVTGAQLHPLFWSIGADTLRMSSSKPNLQQVPKDARGMFGNINGLSIVSVDYSQLEIRIAAAIAKDEALLGVLEHDDVHTAIAAQIFSCTPAEVTGEQRRAAKAASFTLLFGGSARTLSEYSKRMGAALTLEQAETVFRRFFEAFQGLRNTRAKAYEMVRDRRALTVKLPGGARRTLFGDKLSPQVLLNTTVQGTAAIGLKHALAEAKRRGLHTMLGAAVHDELVASVPTPYAQTFANELSEAMVIGMSNVVACEIKVEAKIGHSWS